MHSNSYFWVKKSTNSRRKRLFLYFTVIAFIDYNFWIENYFHISQLFVASLSTLLWKIEHSHYLLKEQLTFNMYVFDESTFFLNEALIAANGTIQTKYWIVKMKTYRVAFWLLWKTHCNRGLAIGNALEHINFRLIIWITVPDILQKLIY